MKIYFQISLHEYYSPPSMKIYFHISLHEFYSPPSMKIYFHIRNEMGVFQIS